MNCKAHDWEFDESDPIGCPVCYGEKQTEQRIIKLLEDAKPEMETDELEWGIDRAIALIKEANLDNSTVHTSADNPITDTHCNDCNEWGCHGCLCCDVEGYCGTCGKGENK